MDANPVNGHDVLGCVVVPEVANGAIFRLAPVHECRRAPETAEIWAGRPSRSCWIDRPLVESLLNLDFLDAARNVVLVGPGGVGKSMIAQNIAHRAVLAGRSVLFVSAAQLLLDLAAQESARALERRLRYFANVGVLVVDELGFLAFDNHNADLFFQVISRRYEKKSLILSTNLAFAEWHTILPNATCATALVERVVHHADIVKIEGESYRMRESKLDAEQRRESRRTKKKP